LDFSSAAGGALIASISALAHLVEHGDAALEQRAPVGGELDP